VIDWKKLGELAKVTGETQSPLKRFGERASQAVQAVNPMSGVHKYLDWEREASAHSEQLFERLDRENPHIDPAIFEKLTRHLSREQSQDSLKPLGAVPQDFLSIAELAKRWRCSRGTVYNVFRRLHLKFTDLGPPRKRGKKAVPLATVLEIEKKLGKMVR
jgi:hypothetical protein